MTITIRKEFKEKVQQHILDSLCTDYTQDPKEQLQNVADAFASWYGPFEKKRTPNRYNAFIVWLNCLPSELSIEFTDYSIHETLKSWFSDIALGYKEPRNEPLFYRSLIVREYLVLCKKYEVKTTF